MRRRQRFAAQTRALEDARVAAIAPPAEERHDPDACPKCGRVLRRGRYLHVKHCKGR